MHRPNGHGNFRTQKNRRSGQVKRRGLMKKARRDCTGRAKLLQNCPQGVKGQLQFRMGCQGGVDVTQGYS
jgi:hypothetical protein